jgi:hypothetical protein
MSDTTFPDTTYSLTPLWAEIRAELRETWAARAALRELRRELASVETPADLGPARPR